MSTKFFYVIIDTTEATQVRTLPKSIINTYIVKALDETSAKNTVLRTFAPVIANQIQNSIYVYDLDSIMYNLDLAENSRNVLPLFSFMPLNGARPVRNLALQKRPAQTVQKEIIRESTVPQSRTEEASNVNVQPKSQTPTPPTIITQQIDPKNSRQVRSAMFQQPDHDTQGQTSDKLSPEQARIVASLGAFPGQNGADEGVNKRINSSTGQNLNQTVQRPSQGPRNGLSQEQFDLLRKVGATPAEPVYVDQGESSEEVPAWAHDSSLEEVPADTPIGSNDLVRLQEEFRTVAEKTGFIPQDSKPGSEKDANVSFELKSNIELQLKEKANQ